MDFPSPWYPTDREEKILYIDNQQQFGEPQGRGKRRVLRGFVPALFRYFLSDLWVQRYTSIQAYMMTGIPIMHARDNWNQRPAWGPFIRAVNNVKPESPSRKITPASARIRLAFFIWFLRFSCSSNPIVKGEGSGVNEKMLTIKK